MPNGFITLTTSGIVEAEADFEIEQIASYMPNGQDPNGGSIVTMISSGPVGVMETVEQIRELIAQEKNSGPKP